MQACDSRERWRGLHRGRQHRHTGRRQMLGIGVNQHGVESGGPVRRDKLFQRRPVRGRQAEPGHPRASARCRDLAGDAEDLQTDPERAVAV